MSPSSQPSTPSTSSLPPDLSEIRKIRFEKTAVTRQSVREKERAERLARGKARLDAQTPARAKYLAEQKKIREDAKAERERILQNIKGDKIERRIKKAREQGGWTLGG